MSFRLIALLCVVAAGALSYFLLAPPYPPPTLTPDEYLEDDAALPRSGQRAEHTRVEPSPMPETEQELVTAPRPSTRPAADVALPRTLSSGRAREEILTQSPQTSARAQRFIAASEAFALNDTELAIDIITSSPEAQMSSRSEAEIRRGIIRGLERLQDAKARGNVDAEITSLMRDQRVREMTEVAGLNDETVRDLLLDYMREDINAPYGPRRIDPVEIQPR